MREIKKQVTERYKDIDGTYDITFEEVKRVRIFPEDEVREIIAQAIRKAKLDLDNSPEKYEQLFEIFNEMARIALEDIQSRFDLIIKPKTVPTREKTLKEEVK
jgi:hypothetical protein